MSGTIVKAFTELRDAMKVALTKSNSLPTDSPPRSRPPRRRSRTSVRGSLNNIDASGLSNPDLEKAAASQEPACKS